MSGCAFLLMFQVIINFVLHTDTFFAGLRLFVMILLLPVQDPQFGIARKLDMDNVFYLFADLRTIYRHSHFAAVIQVAAHPVGGGKKDLFFSFIVENKYTRVLQVFIDDAVSFYIIAPA